jgi:hypothetical protein
MQWINRKLLAVAVVALAVVGGTGAAIAAGGGSAGNRDNSDLKRAAAQITAKDELRADVAKRLGVTVAELEAAVTKAAGSRIDAAEKAGDITAAEADALRDAVTDGHLARRLALPADIAANLGTTEEKLQAAFVEAHKAQAKARIDQAVADGKITKAYGEELKAKIDAGEMPAFGPGFGMGLDGRGHHGPGFGGHGMGGFGAPGMGGGASGMMVEPATTPI